MVICATLRARLAINRERGARRLCCRCRFSGAISKRRYGYVKSAWKWRKLSENRVRADYQNDNDPGGQQEIEDSDSKVNVGRPARARHWNGRFSRNRDGHVKRLLLKFGKMRNRLKIRRWFRR
jgi:hypothetical protein